MMLTSHRTSGRYVFLFASILLAGADFHAVAASRTAIIPTLIADGYEGSEVLELTRLEVDVRIRGHLSRTSYTATFRNHTSTDLNGKFFLPLPGGASVSDLGLFFDGRLRHAVAVERERARIAYESVVHRRVDPVLAEWSEGSGFRYELYPIPANGDKRVFIAFDQELERVEDQLVYQLDLRSLQSVEALTVSIDADDGSRIDVVADSLVHSGVTSLSTSFADVRLDHFVDVRHAAREESLTAWSETDQFWYHSRPVRASLTSGLVARASELVLFVDVSGSAASYDHERVFEFLDELIRRQQPLVRVTLYPFHSHVMPGLVIRSSPQGHASQRLRELLTSLERVGASSYSEAVAGMTEVIRGLSPSSRVVLIGDGISSIGSRETLSAAMVRLPDTHPVTVVTASSNHNITTMSDIASATGGWLVPLSVRSPSDAATSVMYRPSTLEFRSRNESVLDVVPAQVTTLVGEQTYVAARSTVPDFSTLQVRGRTLTGLTLESRILDAEDADLLRGFWARKKLEALLSDPDSSDERLALHGKQYRLLTPRTSLLVLEDVRDYQMFDLPLPDDMVTPEGSEPLPRGMWGFKGIVMLEGSLLPGASVRAVSGPLEAATISDASGRFWLSFPALPPGPVVVSARMAGLNNLSRTYPELPNGAVVELEMQLASIAEAITVTADSPAFVPGGDVSDGGKRSYDSDSSRWNRIECEVCTDLLHLAVRDSDLQLDPEVEGDPDPEWLVRRDWIARIIAHFNGLSNRDERMRFYVEARGRLQGSRVFHIRLAEAMHRDDPQLALRVLLDLAEGEAANAPLLRILGQLAEGWGEIATARQLYERAVEVGAQHPQSWRNLIRLEARSGRRARVGELTKRYALVERDDRFEEPAELLAEELAHLETNGVARSPVDDPETDLRIEASWDSNFNYVDLWVTEPDGKVVVWDDPRGAGTLRFFLTEGYGPQVYEVRDAPAGAYRVHVDFYSEDVTEMTQEPMAHVIAWRRNSRGGWDREDRIVFLSAEDTRPYVTTITVE